MKPGFKTTEFILTLATVVLGALLAVGWIEPVQAEAIEATLPIVAQAVQGVVAAIGAIGAAVAAFGYSRSRGEVKAAEQKRLGDETLYREPVTEGPLTEGPVTSDPVDV